MRIQLVMIIIKVIIQSQIKKVIQKVKAHKIKKWNLRLMKIIRT